LSAARSRAPWTGHLCGRAHDYEHGDAEEVGDGRDDYGTELGPVNVAIHAGSIDLGDAAHALDLSYATSPNASESFHNSARRGSAASMTQ
jgi:hypothetical protein